MTDRLKIINFIHGKLANFLYKIGMVELNYREDDSIEFYLRGHVVRISIDIKPKK